ncbi:phosphate ABC transporter substrate-binding protein [Cytophagales bacterium WSM2-2]|nr:phosphate ABC transporter substrate-binding protein [Cytophagales bacterium WSM2-2]
MKVKLLIALGAILAFACTDKNKKGEILDTPTTGTIKIAVDESLKPLFEAEIDGFEGLYQAAHIKAIYTSEATAVEELLKDSVRLAIVTRKFYPQEKQKLDSVKINGTQVRVAKEAIALIVNKDNPDSLITWSQFSEVLKGNTSRWNQLYPKSNLGDLQVVFDHPQSGIIRYITDTLQLTKLPSYCFAANTNEEVFAHVAKTKNAIGLIGLSWISDKDDPSANDFLKTIKVVAISTDDDFLKPYKAYIAMKKYPLSRDVFMLSREARSGLGSGFIAYVASDKGQRIILKSGLVPATAPIRLVEVKRDAQPKIVK